MDLRRHIKVISSMPDDGATGRAQPPRRVLSMVAVIVAALLLGAALGRALPPTGVAGTDAQSAPATQLAPAAQSAPAVRFTPAAQPAPAAQPSEPFVYFPSQYVNQATETEEHIQAY